MKQRIAIDMDEVLADTAAKIRDVYEQAFGQRLDFSAFSGRKLYEVVPPEHARYIKQQLHQPGFFADLAVIEGSVEGVQRLMEHYEVYIATAAMEFRHSLLDKYLWMERHFPFIHWKNIVFCGSKAVLRTDYLLDDHAYNLEVFEGTPLLYTAYHNLHEQRFTRLDDWGAVQDYFLRA